MRIVDPMIYETSRVDESHLPWIRIFIGNQCLLCKGLIHEHEIKKLVMIETLTKSWPNHLKCWNEKERREKLKKNSKK